MKKFLFLFFTLAMVAGVRAQKLEAVAIKSEGMSVTVDGVLDEALWQEAVKYTLDSVYKNESIADSADCYASFQVAWNEQGIYVAVTVTDDSSNVTGPQGPDWARDMVEIYFDMNIGKLEDGRGTQEGMGHHQVAGLAKDGINNWGSSSAFAYKTNGSNYIKETFVSWTDLKDSAGFVQNPVGSVIDTLAIGFDIYIVDNDRDSTASGRNFRDRLVWSNRGNVTETWDNADDAGIMTFDTSSVNAVANEFVNVAKKVKGLPLNVDGVLDENVWANAPKYKIAQVYKGEEIAGGAEDCSGYFQTLWNYDGIYLAVTVTDDSSNVTGPQGADWARDMVEIYFDMNVKKLKDGKGTQEGQGHHQVAGLAKDGINNWGASSKFAYKMTNSNYVKETFVSWKDLKDSAGFVHTPVDTLAIGLDMYIVDNDRDSTASGRNFRDRLVWANRGNVTETWDNADDGGIMKFNMGTAIENTAMLTVNKVTGDTIIANGILDESIWDSLPKIQMAQVYKGEKITGGANDCSGFFQVAWNEKGLYVAVTVTDDSSNVTGPQGADWARDMVEIYFDMNVGNLDDGNGTQEGKGHYQVAGLAKDGINNWGAGSKFAYLTDGADYVKEAFVRWADLKNVDGDTITPANNMQLGLDVYIVDNDRDSTASGRNFRDRLVWANWGDITETWDNANDGAVIKLSNVAFENVYVPPMFISDIQSVGSAVVYPNPVKDILHIGNVSEKAVVSIFSIEGKMMMQSKEGVTSINISSLRNGIYLVRINDQNKETIKRIIVQ